MQVLDYLDQMMAKQSALNTKNVQKLKEKAKVATEKRLKQMRKAQLKAIKQVEKDEKYLVKLSNNRRLLKAAHSISDIKLVGRTDAISFSPLDRSSSVYSSERPSPKSSSGKSSTSSGLTNFINNKLYIDRLKNSNSHGQNSVGLKQSASVSQSDESAYGSSISSTSGYLSSCSTSAMQRIHYARPKYSDLVAVGNLELPKLYQPSSKSSSKSAKQQSNEQQSVKSNSTIGTKLRGIGGVSRKVQLKRLLLINASSTSDLSSLTASSTTTQNRAKYDDGSTNSRLEANSVGSGSGTSKLCNVQPAIKLKLAADPHLSSSVSSSSRQGSQQVDLSSGSSNIKWPPAPAMTRAVSEPDLSSKLRSSDEVDDDEDEEDGHEGLPDECMSNEDSKDKEETMYEVTKGDNYRHKVIAFDSGASSENSMGQPSGSCAEETQHHLLTKCLSQLKMRHQESIKKQQQFEADLGSSKVQQGSQMRATTKQHFVAGNNSSNNNNTTSCELLQHQMNAGQIMLKPSIIKQQQQNSATNNQLTKAMKFKQQYQYPASSKATTISVDSIGSANSFIKRNQSSSPSKSDQSSSSPTSSISYSSSYASSIEASKPSIVINMSAPTKTIQATPEQQMNKQQVAFKGLQTSQATTPCNQVKPVQVNANVCKETISTFLLSNGLFDLSEVFAKEKIDLEALMLLSEDDLKSLNILLGPRRKLLKAIEDRRFGAQKTYQPMQSNRDISCQNSKVGPMYVMVDTQL